MPALLGDSATPTRQISLAGGEGLQRAGQCFVAQPDAGGRIEFKKARAQLHHGGPGDDAVHRYGQLRLPAGGHAPDPVGHGVNVGQQARGFAQQLGAGLGQPGLARAAVVQQHVQRVLDLAHPVGQGAGHHAEFAGGGGKAAGLRDDLQHGQGVGRQNIAGALHLHLFLVLII